MSSARIAGILYLQFAIFSAAVLWLWLWLGDSPWETQAQLLPTIPGAVELFAVNVIVMIGSTVLSVWLTVCAQVNLVVFGVGVLVTIADLWWNILAMLLCVAPLPFMWVAYKAKKSMGTTSD